MRGQGSNNIVAQNIFATQKLLENNKLRARRSQLCWKCQRDKPIAGGELKFFPGGGGRIFVCQDCVKARKVKP